MSAIRVIHRLRVPKYWLKWITVTVTTSLTIGSLLGLNDLTTDILGRWTALLWGIVASRMWIDTLSYLDITTHGVAMRRGWQYFAIRWDQIEALGMSYFNRRYLPYITLRAPIRGLPRMNLPELTRDQQQRTLTLEGWEESEHIATALHAGLNATTQQWHVIPDFGKSHRNFLYYQRFYWCLSIGAAMLVIVIATI